MKTILNNLKADIRKKETSTGMSIIGTPLLEEVLNTQSTMIDFGGSFQEALNQQAFIQKNKKLNTAEEIKKD